MSAISTCHSPPSLATGHKSQIPFYLHQHSPWAIFTSHCQGSTKAEERHSTERQGAWDSEADTGRDQAGRDWGKLRCLGRETESQGV